VFVEDTAIVLDEIAVITHPGAQSRRAETASVASALGKYRVLARIEAPGTLDGGDVLRVDRTLYVGVSSRSNHAAVEQLDTLLSRFGYRLRAVPVRGCLHLKSAVTQVAPGMLLINPQCVDREHFAGMELVAMDAAEPLGANALLIGHTVIYPASNRATAARLRRHGVHVLTVDVSEMEKAEGAVSCCSLIFSAAGDCATRRPLTPGADGERRPRTGR
jgi:dimethylargininase